MTAIVLFATRVERWLLSSHRRRTLASNRKHLPPNPTGAGARTTRKAVR